MDFYIITLIIKFEKFSIGLWIELKKEIKSLKKGYTYWINLFSGVKLTKIITKNYRHV